MPVRPVLVRLCKLFISYLDARKRHGNLKKLVHLVSQTNTHPSRYLISANQTVILSEPLKHDGVVVFHTPELDLSRASVHPTSANNTFIDFVAANGDVILHIGFRPTFGQLVFNSHHDGQWMTEVRLIFQGIFNHGQDHHTIAVYDHGSCFQIVIDGMATHYYTKQLNAEVTSIKYGLDHDHGMFSDPILAEIYPDRTALAHALPKSSSQ